MNQTTFMIIIAICLIIVSLFLNKSANQTMLENCQKSNGTFAASLDASRSLCIYNEGIKK